MHSDNALFPPLPATTAGAARSVFGRGNPYVMIGDQLDKLLVDVHWTGVEHCGPGRSSASLLGMVTVFQMVTIFQYFEGLPDRRAADAAGRRMEWKYALHLPADFPGLDPAQLVEFRRWLRADRSCQEACGLLLARLSKLGFLEHRGSSIPSVADLLSTVERLSALDRAIGTMGIALEALARREPDWLRRISLPDWYERYRLQARTADLPRSPAEQEDLLKAVMGDLRYLARAVIDSGIPSLQELAEVRALQRVDTELARVANGACLGSGEQCVDE